MKSYFDFSLCIKSKAIFEQDGNVCHIQTHEWLVNICCGADILCFRNEITDSYFTTLEWIYFGRKNWINCLFSSVTTNPNPITNRLDPFRLHAQRSSWMLQFDFDLVWLVSDPPSALSCLWLFWRMHQNQRLDFLLLISNGFYHWKCEEKRNLLEFSLFQLFKIQKFP